MYVAAFFRKECSDMTEKVLGKKDLKLEKPPSGIDADLAIPCFSMGRNPAELATEAAEKINNSLKGSLILKVEPSGPYLNFYVNSEKFCSSSVNEILKLKSKYGSAKNKGSIIIDFSSPNIAKPMNIGHLRSTIIGQSLCNIYRFLGYNVIGDNHLGDWGTQFGKLITAWKMWGEESKLKRGGVEYLTSLYVKFHEEEKTKPELAEEGRKWFRKLESKDIEASKLWKRFSKISLEEFSFVYDMLNVKFDLMLGESFYHKLAEEIVHEAEKKKLAEESEGALIIDFEKHGIKDLSPLLIQKSDESTLYSTRDLATIKYRIGKYRPKKILYVIGSDQKLYLKQIFSAAKLMSYDCDFEHVDFGLVTMSGLKMSTRSGRFVLLKDLLSESMERAEKAIEEKNPALRDKKIIAKQVAIGAVIFNDLKQDRVRNIGFEWEKMLNFEGDSCPYIQYSCVRAGSILEKAGKGKHPKSISLKEPEEITLSKKLSEFPLVIENSAIQCRPNLIAQYLLDIATSFNDFYSKCKVIGSENQDQRIALVSATKIVLENGLGMLNIEVPEKM